MRRVLLTLTVAAGLMIVGAAAAAGPVRSVAVFDFPDPEVYTVCDGFDVVLSNMHIERQALTWYEGETPVVEQRQAQFTGTFTNSATGKTGVFSGRLNLEFDFAAGTLTLTGLMRQVKVSGQPAFIAAGLDVTDTDENVLFHAGRSLDVWYEGLCSAML
jgi:hypothetical protein